MYDTTNGLDGLGTLRILMQSFPFSVSFFIAWVMELDKWTLSPGGHIVLYLFLLFLVIEGRGHVQGYTLFVIRRCLG